MTISQHQPVRRGEGKVGMTCRFRLCREPIFLTRGDGANHQSFEIIRTIRETAGDAAMEEDPEDMARAASDLIELLGLDTGDAPAVE
ncbi:hypothetical protein LJ759_18690 [Arthrobacter sp. zg-Y1110]|uniref:hypothetical protein n=2 Tax=Arthrobacter sp. zg-Y1110 TaxID=2886932 RepID=UPI001D1388C3|nr:hypothetical protein [Arthrobacter sp. zg-Y1110]MCC3292953.1 hypothetical protein [Arthrobacter sp. zg-Y1110]